MPSYAKDLKNLVDTARLADHLDDANIRIVESNEDILLYDTGHIPNAVHIDRARILNDQILRDYITTGCLRGAAFAT